MKQKKVVFSDNENQYARLVTRLRYDKLTQGSFFRELVSLYVDNDIDFAKVIAKNWFSIGRSFGLYKKRV